MYILCCKFFFLMFCLVTNTACAIPYFSDFIYLYFVIIKTFNSEKLVYYIHVFNYIYTYTHTRIVVVWSLSHVRLFVTPWTAACQASLSFTISQSLFKLMAIESVMPSNHLILCCPCLPLPSVFPSISVFSNELALCIRWPKYWSFSISPCNEYSGLIAFRMDLFNLLAVQGTLKSLLQHHSLKASVLPCSTFFMVRLSHPYMTIGKTIALTIQTSIVCKYNLQSIVSAAF